VEGSRCVDGIGRSRGRRRIPVDENQDRGLRRRSGGRRGLGHNSAVRGRGPAERDGAGRAIRPAAPGARRSGHRAGQRQQSGNEDQRERRSNTDSGRFSCSAHLSEIQDTRSNGLRA